MPEQMGEYLIFERVFGNLIGGNMRLVKLWTGSAWAEGPVYFRDGDFLLFSDIPNNRIMRFVPDHTGLDGHGQRSGASPRNNTNGHTRDLQGRLVSCEHGGQAGVAHRARRYGSPTLADRWNGKKLNSPNDAVVKSDGTIWFTDPPYGILTDLEGWQWRARVRRLPRVLPRPRHAASCASSPTTSSSPTASPSRRTRRSSTSPTPAPPTTRTAPATSAPSMSPTRASSRSSRVFATCDAGLFDGFRLRHRRPRLEQCRRRRALLRPQTATLLGKILVPEVVSNVCFGGVKRNRLYICGTTSLYAVLTHVNGAQRP